MDFRNVKSLLIGGKPVARLLIDGLLAWKRAEPVPPEPVGEAYIETDGVASYIDLGFIPTASMTYEIDVLTSDLYENSIVMSCFASRRVRYSIISDGGYGPLSFTYPTISEKVSRGRLKIVYDGTNVVVNGIRYDVTAQATNAYSNLRFASAGTVFSYLRLYSAKFWESGELIRDLVPYSGPRGVGLLDRVHDVLYTNAGGGTLTYGEEGGAWTNPYITDGLLAMWDSEWNEAGGVHNPDLMQLNDLMGNLGAIHVSALGDKWSVRPAGTSVQFNRSEYPALDAFIGADGTFARTLDGCSSFEVPSGELPSGVRNIFSMTLNLVTAAGSDSTQYLGYGVTAPGKCFNTRAMLTNMVSGIDGIDGVPRTYCCRVRIAGPQPGAATAYMDGVAYGEYAGTVSSTRYERVSRLTIQAQNANYADLMRNRCLRLYSRELTDEEVAHNARVDRERFGS